MLTVLTAFFAVSLVMLVPKEYRLVSCDAVNVNLPAVLDGIVALNTALSPLMNVVAVGIGSALQENGSVLAELMAFLTNVHSSLVEDNVYDGQGRCKKLHSVWFAGPKFSVTE